MTNEKLIIGDVVTLKSGGPWMTIRRIVDEDKDNIWATWFVDGISHFAAFPEGALIKQQRFDQIDPESMKLKTDEDSRETYKSTHYAIHYENCKFNPDWKGDMNDPDRFKGW